MKEAEETGLRLDKWLWAARFHKTRSLASAAAEGGKVRVNGERAKPAKIVRPGDMLDIVIGDMHWTLQLRALTSQRGPASAAATLYTETAESLARRQAVLDERRMRRQAGAPASHRPTKRDRRRLDRLAGHS